MTLRIIIIFLIFFFFGYKVFYYKEPFNSNILKTEIDIENGPTPYNYVIPSSTPAEYKGTTTNVVESENKQKITESRMNVYKAFMDTDCKNNFCCEDGMTFSEELGVCIKNNDNSYLNEFNALGPTPPERLNTKQIDKIYKGLNMK
tara:strand:+ start:223 stop:660 length:438 start_codon:yes stop_codon:yes gene_type:complete